MKIIKGDQLPLKKDFDKFRANMPDRCIITQGAHCGIWWKKTIDSAEKYGVIGHYFARDEKISKELLDTAAGYLKEQGCNKAIGPMDGNTWKPYRFVTWSNGSLPFLMEPANPECYPEYWKQAHFLPCHEYISTMISDLGHTNSKLWDVRKKLDEKGIKIRPLNLSKFEQELSDVYALSVDAFKDNVIYTPIDEKSFLQQYLPFKDKIQNDYVRLAHDRNNRCCGFVFGIPDLLGLQQGSPPDRLIIKTLAVSFDHRGLGLGAVLVEEIEQNAFRNGIGSAIHALMHSKNISANIGKNHCLMRRYTLFERVLT